ncbi:MAG: hypothetical protein Q9222_002514 [Ikaeria aurantiellina]
MHLPKQRLACLYFAIVVQLASSIPLQPPAQPLTIGQSANPSNLTSALSNLGYGPVPPGFKIEPDIELPRTLPEDATLLNVIHALESLGQDDYYGAIGPQLFNTPYSQTTISLRLPRSKRIIQRQYVMWGLILAIGYMTEYLPMLMWSHYTFRLNDEEIGGVSFGIPPSMALDPIANNITNLKDSTSTKVTARDDQSSDIYPRTSITDRDAQTTSDSITEPLDNRLHVTCRYIDSMNLDKMDLFQALMVAIAQAAVPLSNTRTPEQWAAQGLDGQVRVYVRSAGETTAPFLKYSYVIEALAKAADFLVANQRFGGLLARMEVGEVEVGSVLMRHV